jgi:hypothetical protein
MAEWFAAGAAIAGTVAAAVGTTVGVAGAVEQNKQARANAEMQAQQLEYNKRVEEREAARVEAENAENARRQREAAEELKARQRALLGKSGAAMESGSPLAVLGQTAADEELKVQDIHYAGANQAQHHREQAKMFAYQAGVARAQAPSKSSLGLNIAGQMASGLGSLASIGMGYANYSKK